jgi:hypothetical protein
MDYAPALPLLPFCVLYPTFGSMLCCLVILWRKCVKLKNPQKDKKIPSAPSRVIGIPKTTLVKMIEKIRRKQLKHVYWTTLIFVRT